MFDNVSKSRIWKKGNMVTEENYNLRQEEDAPESYTQGREHLAGQPSATESNPDGPAPLPHQQPSSQRAPPTPDQALSSDNITPIPILPDSL